MSITQKFLEAAEYGDVKVVEECLSEGGLDVDAQNQYGNTALIEAANHGDTDIVKLLMPSNPSLDLTSTGGRTALMCAAFKGHGEIVEILLKNGANVNMSDLDGENAKSLAKLRGNDDIVTLLEK